jgi:hypothetical protein
VAIASSSRHDRCQGQRATTEQSALETKIDNMVALIIALSRVIAGAGLGSVYNMRAKAGGEASISRSV